MIPARIGSKRVPKKNLRLIEGQPLISYVLETIKKTDIFDEVYLNADDKIFGKLAEDYGVEFYHRNKNLASDSSTNDEFMYDFMNNVESDIVIQILPTSPLLTKEEVFDFVNYMVKEKVETLISVEHKQIGSIYKNKPINFDKFKKNPPSQEMEPIKAYATALMGWDVNTFKHNIEKYGCAYHGGDSNTDYYELKGLSTIDIDNEEDFLLASSIIKSLNHVNKNDEIKYYE
jgi:CMP-N,N'-diacetyllegionaminic acid synthase